MVEIPCLPKVIMGKIAVNHEILRWARESLNYGLEDVADRIKKSVETIESWEKGKESPTYVQLETLAYQIYKRPIAVFFFPEPPKEDTPTKSFRTLPDVEVQKLSATFIRLFREAHAMQIKLNELCERKNPAEKRIFEDIQVTQQVDINRLAELVRKYLGTQLRDQIQWRGTDEALSNWRDAIQERGVFVFKKAFKQDEISGFCLYHSRFPVIYINNTMPRTRQIFTIFHELAHLLFKTGGIAKLRADYIRYLSGNKREVEVFCNRFAGVFLVPDKDFDEQAVNTDDQSISILAERYNVSREVILRKLLDRGMVDQGYYDQKAKTWIEEAEKQRRERKDGGNYYYTTATYLGNYYLNLAFGKYYQREISAYELADYLGVKVDILPKLEETY